VVLAVKEVPEGEPYVGHHQWVDLGRGFISGAYVEFIER
jgi:hypothetical protein